MTVIIRKLHHGLNGYREVIRKAVIADKAPATLVEVDVQDAEVEQAI